LINLISEPEIFQNIETLVIIEKYVIDGQNISFNLAGSPISFDSFILELQRTEEKEIKSIFVSFENVDSKKILDLSKVINFDHKDLDILQNHEKVSAIFSITSSAIAKYIQPEYYFMKPKNSIFDFKDDNNSIVLLNFKYFSLEKIVK
jgi:hypothetical protein